MNQQVPGTDDASLQQMSLLLTESAAELDSAVDDDDDVEEEVEQQQPRSAAKSAAASKQHYFAKELRCMMYGFGDELVGYTETVDLLEEIVLAYLQQFTRMAMLVGKEGKVTLEDVWYLIRRDAKKYARVKDLLSMSEELRRARKAFDESVGAGGGAGGPST